MMTPTPRVAVWAGRGASYSWVWWADLLEDLWWFKVDLLVETREVPKALERADVLLVGGGDVAALRMSLDWDHVRGWVSDGGRLVATCAGAYLLRDWAGAGIANVVDDLPDRIPARAWTDCEEGLVVHPVRGPVKLASAGGATLTAPMYGGPIFNEPTGEHTRVVARYDGVTRGSEWLLADRPDMLAGTPAVLLSTLGDGLVILSGPHLEHPDHQPAHLWLAGLLGWSPGTPWEGVTPPAPGTDAAGEDVVRRLASVRGRAVSLSGESWRSGDKVWNGDRVAGFADAVIPRARTLARWGWGPRGRAGGLLPLLEGAAERLGLRSRPDAWDQGFSALSEAVAILLEAYFANRRAGMSAPPRAVKRPPRLAPEGGFNAPRAPATDDRGVSRQ
jgi:hypothetical protein